jgi:group I intron endonuclease
MIGIYKIISPKGKIYVGQSTNIRNRKYFYETSNCKGQPKLLNSLKKYGWELHKFEILEECDLNMLDEREIYFKNLYLKQYGWEKMLFCQLIDGKGGYKSEETKKKMSEFQKGRMISPEHREKLRNGRTNSGNIIYQYDLEGNFIKEWPNHKKACDVLKINTGYICVVKDDFSKTAGGYMWSSIKHNNIPPNTPWGNHKKPVLQYDLEGNFIKEWPSAKNASKELSYKIQNITACCRGERETAYKHKWKYKK